MGTYSPAEKQSVYSTASVNWASSAVVLVGWLGLWHINLCRLFNAKCIFMKIVSYILNNSV